VVDAFAQVETGGRSLSAPSGGPAFCLVLMPAQRANFRNGAGFGDVNFGAKRLRILAIA